MNNERARVRRLRLVVGILGGMFVGTAHALVSHAMSRPASAAAEVGGVDIAVVTADGTVLLVVAGDARAADPQGGSARRPGTDDGSAR